MGLTDIERRALKGNSQQPAQIATAIEPLAVRLVDAQRISGLSRSDLYRRAARGEITFLKAGVRVLVDYQSLKAVVSALPIATIRIAA
jgi:hypothetical protein